MTRHAFKSTGTCISNSLGASGCRKFIPGDIAWTKIDNHSWWPAQVVDEKSIDTKPKKKLKDEILVRLYGSYEYLYVDPLRCNMEFENILKQDNITAKDAVQKSLEGEISPTVSGGKTRRKLSHFRENTMTGSPRGKMQRREKIARNQEVGSLSLGSSHKQNEACSEERQKDDASDKTASNSRAKQDEARKQRVDIKYSKESSEGNSRRQGTPENQNIKDTEVAGASKVQSIKRDCLRRSPRNAGKKQMEKDKVEHSKYQSTEHCGSGNLNMIDKAKSGAFNIKDMMQLGSRQLRKNDKKLLISEALKEKSEKQVGNGILGEASKEKIEKLGSGILGDGATKPEIVKHYTLRKRKHKDVREEFEEKVTLEISKDKGKDNHVSTLPDSANKGVSSDLVHKRIKQMVIRELNCKNAAERTKNCVGNVVTRNKTLKPGEAEKKNETTKTISGASKVQNMKQNGSKQQKHEDAKELVKIESPKSARQAKYAAPDISARKVKVMQNLGLIAPSGSPFQKNGILEAVCLKF